MKYYLAHWVWDADGAGSWRAPDGTVGMVDLRSMPQRAAPGPTPQGWGFFALGGAGTIDDQPDALLLGTDLSDTLTAQQRTDAADALGVGPIPAGTILDMLWALLTDLSDPTGQTFAGPLMPTKDLILELNLAGHSRVRAEPFDGDRHGFVLERLQNQYRALREKRGRGKGWQRHYLRYLGYLEQRYGLPAERFIPPGLPPERPLPPRTTYADGFNRNDQALDFSANWTAITGSWEIQSNKAVCVSDGADAGHRFEGQLSGDDMRAEAEILDVGDGGTAENVGVLTRLHETNFDGYYYALSWTSFSGKTSRIWSIVGGTSTQLDSVADTWDALPVVLWGEATGSTIRLYVDSVEVNSITDTGITGNLFGGINSFSESAFRSPALDNWSVTDETAPSGPFKPPEATDAVNNAILAAVDKYNLPRWFYYALIHRESSFNPNAVNESNGGVGLTQLTGVKHNGEPYPMNLSAPDNSHQQWIWDMGINIYGEWVRMTDVSAMTDPFDPTQNLDRFSTVHGVPAFAHVKTRYSLADNDEYLRAVAFHWNRGIFLDYDPNDAYLDLYDGYVSEYQGPVEAEDGVWDGQPRLGPTSPEPGAITATSALFDILEPPGPPGEVVLPAPPAVHFPANVTAEFLVRILDRNLQMVAEPREIVSCSWRRTWWEGDSFSLTLPGRVADPETGQLGPNPVVKHLREHNAILIFRRERGSGGYISEYMGFIEEGRVYVDGNNEEVWEARGASILGSRVIDPPLEIGEAYEEIAGNAEDVMRRLIRRSLGDLADDPDRRVPYIDVAPNLHRGPAVHIRARYDNLLEKLGEIGRQANLGFTVRAGALQGTNQVLLLFDFVPGVDRSVGQTTNPHVTFSPRNLNIERQEYAWTNLRRATYGYVAGKGEGVDRTVLEVPHFGGQNAPSTPSALFVEGVESYVKFRPEASVRGLSQVTVEGWVLLGEDKGDNPMFSELILGSVFPRWRMAFFPDRTLHLGISPHDDGDAQGWNLTTQAPLFRWVWVCAQVDYAADEVTLRMWRPDEFDIKQTFTFDFITAGFKDETPESVTMGFDKHFNEPFFHGRFAQWRLWNAYLSDADVAAVRTDPNLIAGTIPAGLRHHWKFDDGLGTWVRDSLGQADGEIFGVAAWMDGPTQALGRPVGLDRIETFIDARDIQEDDPTAEQEALQGRALSKFRGMGPKARLEAAILPTGPYRYRTHWDLGDIVTVRNEAWGISVDLRVMEVEITIERGHNPDIRVAFGSPIPTYPAIVRRDLQRIEPELHR